MPADLPILVRRSLIASPDPVDRVQAVVHFVSELIDAMYLEAEIPRPAMVVYSTDYYLGQVHNGGVCQFVHHSRWNPFILACVDEGLRAIAAAEHLALFAEVRAELAALGPGLPEFLAIDSIVDPALLERLEDCTSRFYAIEGTAACITPRLAAYVASLPGLEALDDEPYLQRVRMLTDLDDTRRERLQVAEEAETAEGERNPVEKALRSWAADTGRAFDRLTGVCQEPWEGGTATAIHFFASGAHFRAFPVEEDRLLLIVDDEDVRITLVPLGGPPEAETAQEPPASTPPQTPRRRRIPAPRALQPSRDIPRWTIIVGLIVLVIIIRLALRASSH